MDNRLCIVGTGGFGREVLCCVIDSLKHTPYRIQDVVTFLVDDDYFSDPQVHGVRVIRLSDFDPADANVLIGVGDPLSREKIANRLPVATRFATLVHPSAVVSEWVQLGEGTIVTAGVILTCDIQVGKHAHFNLHSTVGHDCIIGDYFTSAPAMNMSGKCHIRDRVYFGTNSSIREGVNVCSDVTIGMGGVVVKHIDQPGVYIGNPLRKLEKV